MKLWSVLRKTMREQLRDFWTWLLTLSLAPFFVFMYWMLFGEGGSTTYDVLVINQDTGVETQGIVWNAGEEVSEVIGEVKYENGQSMLIVKPVTDRASAEKRLRDRDAELLLIIPPDFSQALATGRASPTVIRMIGDRINPYYGVVTIITNAAITSYLTELSGVSSPVQINEQALGGTAARTEFETWVPNLFLMAAILLIYQASITVAREIESGTIRRLKITPMSSFDFMGGICISQLVIGALGVILTLLFAVALGFHSEGPLWVAVVLGVVLSFGMVGVGLWVACFSRTVARAFIIANFPLFLMFFFTGAFMPMPTIGLFTIGGRTIGLFDFLPPTYAIVALNKVLNLGVGLDAVAYELAALSVLSLLYFAGGVGLFRRIHLQRS